MKVKISFFSVLLFTSLVLIDPLFSLATLIAVALHELGHVVAAKICKIKMSEFGTSIYGARLHTGNDLFSYKDEIFLCLMGPAVNFLCLILFAPVYSATKNTFVLYFLTSSLILGTLNILPIKTFDGGRILFSLLSLFASLKIAARILSIVSFTLIFIFWSVSVYLLIVAKAGLSIFAFSLSLFSKFFAVED